MQRIGVEEAEEEEAGVAIIEEVEEVEEVVEVVIKKMVVLLREEIEDIDREVEDLLVVQEMKKPMNSNHLLNNLLNRINFINQINI